MGYENIEDEARVTYDYEQYQNRLDISIEDDPSGDAAANYDEYATLEAERSRLSGRENEIIDIDKSALQEEPMKPNAFVEKMYNEEPVIENIAGQPMSVIKRAVLGNLLKKVVPIDYFKVCESLGWMPTQNKDGSDKPPLQKHYQVATTHQLLPVAENNHWHLIRDGGFSYIYTGCFWISLDKDELKNLLKDVAIRQGYPKINARDSNFINALYEQSLQDGFFVDRPLEKSSMINLNNCTLVLNSNGVRVKDFDYKDFLTHQLPFDYDENAKNTVFLDYLNDVLPDEQTQITLQEVCGYLFIKGLKLEKIFFLYGAGANGKSVLFEVLNGMIGDENISQYALESLTDDKVYHRAKIKDKIVNYGTDIKLNKIDAGMFKTLASGEPVEARLPYCDPFIMSDYAKLIFNVNRLDNANIEHTHGFYRRILIIPFNVTIKDEDQDKSLHKKILENKEGVLNWIIEGAKRVINNEDIYISDECKKTKSRFIKETDSAALFLDDKGYIASDNSNVLLKDLYDEYKIFCGEDGYGTLGKTNFSKRLQALGLIKSDDVQKRTCFRLEKNVQF